ncbi:FAD-dependent oxidoreductase [Bacillus sp. B15-48]|uniref:NAD(P)/FAD-dependent oxidoreductase n=1 Tax=Bacillus sp. B15-48 TaxID=1548601 RepID=UPI0019400B7E|nr:FAD-dependent oxidoreductase [Bacillus sp. B15-48]MBM4761635.1 NAD(P)-binding protein [Bacillus sp. B15-48]
MAKTYCIIGSGVAAVNAAKAIRDHDKEGRITIFGAEPNLPYNRIKLSKELFSDLMNPKVLIKKEKWYETQQIEVINQKITAIDTDNFTITTSEGETVSYDKLLICTGSKNRKLPIEGIDLQGVFTIRERHEAEEFKAFIADKEHVVNVGGGIQGLETAWSLLKAGKQVTILEAAPRLMARQLDEQTSSLLQAKIEEAGVTVHVHTGIEKVVGQHSVEAVVAGGEDIRCDSVIYSIGVIPNLDLVINSEIDSNRGIVVNERMETNISGIYAAGDVAELNGAVEGLWGRAMDQGKAAGTNMAAEQSISFEKTIPLTVFNAFDLPLFSIGLVDESQCDDSLIEEDGSGKYTRVFIKNEKLVGVISLEGVAASLPYKTAIEKEVSLEGMDFSKLTISELMSELKERLQAAA